MLALLFSENWFTCFALLSYYRFELTQLWTKWMKYKIIKKARKRMTRELAHKCVRFSFDKLIFTVERPHVRITLSDAKNVFHWFCLNSDINSLGFVVGWHLSATFFFRFLFRSIEKKKRISFRFTCLPINRFSMFAFSHHFFAELATLSLFLAGLKFDLWNDERIIRNIQTSNMHEVNNTNRASFRINKWQIARAKTKQHERGQKYEIRLNFKTN